MKKAVCSFCKKEQNGYQLKEVEKKDRTWLMRILMKIKKIVKQVYRSLKTENTTYKDLSDQYGEEHDHSKYVSMHYKQDYYKLPTYEEVLREDMAGYGFTPSAPSEDMVGYGFTPSAPSEDMAGPNFTPSAPSEIERIKNINKNKGKDDKSGFTK